MLGGFQALHSLAKLLDISGLVILGHAQFTLDDLELLTQEELALVLGHLLLDFRANLGLQARHFELLVQQHEHALHTLLQRDGVKDVLQVGKRTTQPIRAKSSGCALDVSSCSPA